MRHFRSYVLAGVALAGLVPSLAFASAARIDGLGLQPDYVQDYVNVIHYPSTIVKYQNLVYGDLGIKDTDGGDLNEFEDNDEVPFELDNSARSMGAHLKLWKSMPGVFGIQFNENATPISPAYGANYWNRNRNQGLMLLWGHDFGGVTAGFQFNNTSSELEATDLSVEPIGGPGPALPGSVGNSRQLMNSINAALGSRPWNTTGFGGGVSFDFDGNGRSHTADLGIQYRSMSYENIAGAPGATVTDESDGNYGLSINARSQYATSDNTYLVPVVNYWKMSLDNRVIDLTDPANDFEAENSVTGWNIGLAESWVFRDADLLTLGLQFGSQDIDYADPRVSATPFSAEYATMPQIFGSAEVHPMSWFHVRVGASKAFSSKAELSDGAGGTIEVKDSPLGYTLGAGFRIGGRLDLDAVLNQDFAFTGGWAASGNEETPFSRLSATYRW